MEAVIELVKILESVHFKRARLMSKLIGSKNRLEAQLQKGSFAKESIRGSTSEGVFC